MLILKILAIYLLMNMVLFWIIFAFNLKMHNSKEITATTPSLIFKFALFGGIGVILLIIDEFKERFK